MSINISAKQAETFKNYLMRRAELTAEETGYDPAFILDGYIETLEDADSQKTAMVMITPTKVQPRWDLRASDLLATDWEVVETEYRATEVKK